MPPRKSEGANTPPKPPDSRTDVKLGLVAEKDARDHTGGHGRPHQCTERAGLKIVEQHNFQREEDAAERGVEHGGDGRAGARRCENSAPRIRKAEPTAEARGDAGAELGRRAFGANRAAGAHANRRQHNNLQTAQKAEQLAAAAEKEIVEKLDAAVERDRGRSGDDPDEDRGKGEDGVFRQSQPADKSLQPDLKMSPQAGQSQRFRKPLKEAVEEIKKRSCVRFLFHCDNNKMVLQKFSDY
jgi:hypothetical protein